MGEPAKRHVSSICGIKCYRSKVQKHRMHILLALLYVSTVVAPGCSSLPTKGDSIRNTIHSIVNIAQITLVHIKKLRTKLPVAPQIELSTPSIEGLTSISHDLGLLDNELQSPFTELFSQIQADVSSLEGRVRSLAITMECPIQARPGGQISNILFPDSHLYQTLTKVQRYLEKFLLSKDKLKTSQVAWDAPYIWNKLPENCRTLCPPVNAQVGPQYNWIKVACGQTCPGFSVASEGFWSFSGPKDCYGPKYRLAREE